MHRSHGHCMTMGTASTMASMVEALGIGLPGNAAYPAVDGRRNVLARMAGRRIVDMVHEDQQLADILTREAFENAIKTLAAIGGSTNAVIHLIAIAGRIGVKLGIDDFDRLASELPCLVNLQPSGAHLMEDFCYAGGLPAVMKEIAPLLHLGAVTASGKTVGENIADAENFNTEVIKTMAAPFKAKAGIAVLRGNLAPRGAIIKPSAATPALMTHRGRAVVFEDSDDFHKRIDDESLDVDETCILVLKNCGPKGYPGMAEVGNMPLPPKVLRKGITDMVRISDARMSGTAYGTVVLHTAPEAAAGGPLAAVRNGDFIELDVPNRRLHLDISDAELGEAAAGLEAAGAAARERLLEALHRPRAPGRPGRRPRLPGRTARRVRAEGQPLSAVRTAAGRGQPPATMPGVGLYLGVVQFFFAATWIVYVLYLPQLAAQAGIGKAAVAWILMADQLVFVFADYASGVAADRVSRAIGRIGGWLLAATLVSCAAFLALPFVAPGASPAIFLALTLIWARHLVGAARAAAVLARQARRQAEAAGPGRAVAARPRRRQRDLALPRPQPARRRSADSVRAFERGAGAGDPRAGRGRAQAGARARVCGARCGTGERRGRGRGGRTGAGGHRRGPVRCAGVPGPRLHRQRAALSAPGRRPSRCRRCRRCSGSASTSACCRFRLPPSAGRRRG